MVWELMDYIWSSSQWGKEVKPPDPTCRRSLNACANVKGDHDVNNFNLQGLRCTETHHY